MQLDIHVHTTPGSRCSSYEIESYLKEAASLGLETLCITNHGELSDFEALSKRAPVSLNVIPGVEISSAEGDFLIFSTDLDFLRSLEPVQSLSGREARPARTAVVWAHPFAGIPGGLPPADDHIRAVAERVDGIEVYNGNWPDAQASSISLDIARHYGLAQLGGSDAHGVGQLLRCWTETGDIYDTAGLIDAIKSRKTRAGKD